MSKYSCTYMICGVYTPKYSAYSYTKPMYIGVRWYIEGYKENH